MRYIISRDRDIHDWVVKVVLCTSGGAISFRAFDTHREALRWVRDRINNQAPRR